MHSLPSWYRADERIRLVVVVYRFSYTYERLLVPKRKAKSGVDGCQLIPRLTKSCLLANAVRTQGNIDSSLSSHLSLSLVNTKSKKGFSISRKFLPLVGRTTMYRSIHLRASWHIELLLLHRHSVLPQNEYANGRQPGHSNECIALKQG